MKMGAGAGYSPAEPGNIHHMRYENIVMTDVGLPFNINEHYYSPNITSLPCAVHDVVYENITATQTGGAAMCFMCARNSTRGLQCRDIHLRNVRITASEAGCHEHCNGCPPCKARPGNAFYCENALGDGTAVSPPLGDCLEGAVAFEGQPPGVCL